MHGYRLHFSRRAVAFLLDFGILFFSLGLFLDQRVYSLLGYFFELGDW
ncbi:MAG: hypothetical protein QW756_01950 [Nitrososphaerota archaeon]